MTLLVSQAVQSLNGRSSGTVKKENWTIDYWSPLPDLEGGRAISGSPLWATVWRRHGTPEKWLLSRLVELNKSVNDIII